MKPLATETLPRAESGRGAAPSAAPSAIIVAAAIAVFYLATSIYISAHRLYWFDEIFIVRIAKLPSVVTMWRALTSAADTMPPGYHLMMRLWCHLFGYGEVATRLPSAIAMVVGFLINKFRGDPSLFAEGLRLIEERTSWPSLGMIPYFAAAQKLPAEDAMALGRADPTRHGGVTIAVPRLARIANFDEFDPLSLEPNVDLVMVAPGEPLPVCDLVILPGSKATIADLAFFRAQGWDIDLFAHVRRGGRVLGLCGGYQMLGRRIADPKGAEGPAGEVAGLGLLDVETTLRGDKALVAVAGTCLANGARFEGYEMHIGRTTGPGTARPLLRYADAAMYDVKRGRQSRSAAAARDAQR